MFRCVRVAFADAGRDFGEGSAEVSAVLSLSKLSRHKCDGLSCWRSAVVSSLLTHREARTPSPSCVNRNRAVPANPRRPDEKQGEIVRLNFPGGVSPRRSVAVSLRLCASRLLQLHTCCRAPHQSCSTCTPGNNLLITDAPLWPSFWLCCIAASQCI